MIYLEQIVGQDLSEHVTTRARHCTAVKIANGNYRVVPMTYGYEPHHGKAKRRVQFGIEDGRIFATCRDYYTDEPCEANVNGKVCCHVVAAYYRFLRNAEMQQQKAA